MQLYEPMGVIFIQTTTGHVPLSGKKYEMFHDKATWTGLQILGMQNWLKIELAIYFLRGSWSWTYSEWNPKYVILMSVDRVWVRSHFDTD